MHAVDFSRECMVLVRRVSTNQARIIERGNGERERESQRGKMRRESNKRKSLYGPASKTMVLYVIGMVHGA